ncbi:MAG TPA: hypothetical protein VJ417_09135 [Candidatus Glassbacteria bacterium]|nr:hypothetical protein [Candidatus Glassbacteria bacterium]
MQDSLEKIGRMVAGFSGGGPALGGRFDRGRTDFPNTVRRPDTAGFYGGMLSSLDQLMKRYDQWLTLARGGNRELFDSFSRLFGMIAEQSNRAYETAGKGFAGMQEKMYAGLAEYAGSLSSLTGAAGRAFLALRAMNPVAAMLASSALSLIGSFFNRRSASAAPASSVLAYANGGPAAAGTGGGSNWTGPQVVNVYIDGIKTGGDSEVDRTLGRAGVDRQLRDRIRELVRSGANPVRQY